MAVNLSSANQLFFSKHSVTVIISSDKMIKQSKPSSHRTT